MSHFVSICKAADLPEGSLLQTELADGTPLCVANVEGRFLVIGGECTHAGGPLGEGQLEGLCVVCPWHDASFDLESGEPRTPPAHEAVPTYRVRIEEGDVQVEVDD